MCFVEVIIVGHNWCRHYFRPRYCRSNSSYKELSVDLSVVDLSNVCVITLELINVYNNNEMILDLNLLIHWMVTPLDMIVADVYAVDTYSV